RAKAERAKAERAKAERAKGERARPSSDPQQAETAGGDVFQGRLGNRGVDADGRLIPRAGVPRPNHSPVPAQFPENSLRNRFGSENGLSSRNSAAQRVKAIREDLGKFDRQCASLLQLLQDDSLRNQTIRSVLPLANRISSDARVILQNGGVSQQRFDFGDSYRVLDQGWRQLAFRLRDLGGVSSDALAAFHACDQLINRMSRELGVGPQFDRHGLHDLLLVTATNLQTVHDDLRLAEISNGVMQRLSRELRLIRQNALNEADRVGEASQEDVVRGLNGLTLRWRLVRTELDRITDVHLQLRVQSVGENFRQAHALVWIDMPYDDAIVPSSARRLELLCQQLVGQLTSIASNADDDFDRDRMLATAVEMCGMVRDLNEQINRRDPRLSLQTTFSELDRDWAEFEPLLRNRAWGNNSTVAGIHSECRRLRSALATGGVGVQLVDFPRLRRTAAAIESTAAFVDADLQRYSRLLTPLAFRERLLTASAGFQQTAKRFHELLDQRADISAVRIAAGVMSESWQRLSVDLREIESHGISVTRGTQMKRDLRELMEYVAEVSSAFGP
ncbi:MAG: hypothetical protein OSA98_18960, partial [Rubripirellula sp.]|nr:hypothetical protein [Rubripirellula sp.]